ncbi:AAA ATPase domain-containing protein [Microlunatus flavus]|uniref:AAA ATPase domain-containing protein n=2 Tax=Microlunatus flavus TaxID=1036181 RepID=A0A1H8ZVR8_9ACTN|nr:AAA ATPase domain-containing protein [Microlunatus flavus]
MVLYGLRGVGKTVLLAELAKQARDRAWVTAKFEAGSGKALRPSLGEALHGPLSDLARPGVGTRVLRALKTALSFKASYDTAGTWNFGLDLTGQPSGGADTGSIEADVSKLMRDVSAAAGEEGVGLALLVDEAQDLTSEELTALCAAIHLAGQDGWPLLVGLAGLPSLPRILAEAKSYSERLFEFEHIRELDEDLARSAVVEPAEAEDVAWEPDALALVIRETSGYPYFLQQLGQDTWNLAEGSPITLADARAGAERGRAALDTGFFRARWDRATRAEQRYLRAMAQDGDAGSQSGTVAERLGRKVTALGPVRASLIAKGLVYAPEHGVVAFTVPGMAAFVTRQSAENGA